MTALVDSDISKSSKVGVLQKVLSSDGVLTFRTGVLVAVIPTDWNVKQFHTWDTQGWAVLHSVLHRAPPHVLLEPTISVKVVQAYLLLPRLLL